MAFPKSIQAAENPRRLTAGERRRQLIEAAIDVFSRRGFAGTTKEIAAAAGVTEALIFRHFANKEKLYTAILDHRKRDPGKEEWLAGLQSCMRKGSDESIFRGIVSKVIDVVREDARFERVMLYAALEGHALAAMYHKEFAIPIIDMLCAYIARRQREGAIRKMKPRAIVYAVAGMAQQYAIHTHMFKYTDSGFTDEEAIETFTRILMDGIGVKPRRRREK